MAFADSAQGGVLPQMLFLSSCDLTTTENVHRPKTRHCKESLAHRNYASTINIFFSVVHGILKVKFGRLLEH